MIIEDRQPVGIVVTGTAAAVVAAYQLAEAMGIDVDGLIKSGVDTVLSWVGIGTCSGKNKSKYRKMVGDASIDQLHAWIKKRRVHGATGKCNKYALALAIKKVALADKAAKAKAQSGGGKGKTKAPTLAARKAQWAKLTQQRQARRNVITIPPQNQRSASSAPAGMSTTTMLMLGAAAAGALYLATK